MTGAAATLYGDVDGNGSITLSDAITLNKFLAGQGYLLDTAPADVNLSGTIDALDVQILMDFIIQKLGSLPYTG